MTHKEQLGFLTIACNTPEVNYLRLAFKQAQNIKRTQKNNRYAVAVDADTRAQITHEHRKVFDYIIDIPEHNLGTFGAESFLFDLTPFKETIKLESDLVFTRSIDHWIHAFRLRDMVISTGCRNYRQELSDVRRYRKMFDDNYLPDIYNGLMYFRYSKTAKDFFDTARKIFQEWHLIVNYIKNCRESVPSTDVVFALTARIIGEERCTLPGADFINFVHMKPGINEFDEDLKFTEVFITEHVDDMIRINNINQLHPLHYYVKDFV